MHRWLRTVLVGMSSVSGDWLEVSRLSFVASRRARSWRARGSTRDQKGMAGVLEVEWSLACSVSRADMTRLLAGDGGRAPLPPSLERAQQLS